MVDWQRPTTSCAHTTLVFAGVPVGTGVASSLGMLPRSIISSLALALSLCACAAAPTGPAGSPLLRPAPSPANDTHARIVVPDCTLQEIAYFQCMLDAPGTGAVAVCGRPGPTGSPVELQVRLVTPDGTALVMPSVPSAREIDLDVETRPQFISQTLSFDHHGRHWAVYSEHDVQVGPRPPARGLRVGGGGSESLTWSCVPEAIDRLGELEPILEVGLPNPVGSAG